MEKVNAGQPVARNCGTCSFARIHPDFPRGPQLGCFRFPPTPHVIMGVQTHPETKEQVQVITSMGVLRPIVEVGTAPCGEYKMRLLVPGTKDIELVTNY